MPRYDTVMSEQSTADIFVSYASHDRPAVYRLVDALTAAGYAVWFDRHCIRCGDYFATEIARGLKGCRQFVLACSPVSLKSDNVHDEFAMALRQRMPHVLPVWLTRPDRLPDRYELQLGKIQYIETAGRPEAAWLADVLASVRKAGIPLRTSLDLPTTREAFWASVRGQQWEDAVRHGRRLLSADPADAHAAEAVGRAEGWRNYHEQQLVTRLASTRDPEAWWQAARAHPTAAWADHALFTAAVELPPARLPELRAECERASGHAAQVALAVIAVRCDDPRGAVERLETVLRADPFHTAALHYRTRGDREIVNSA